MKEQEIKHGMAINSFLEEAIGNFPLLTRKFSCIHQDEDGTSFEVFIQGYGTERTCEVLRVSSSEGEEDTIEIERGEDFTEVDPQSFLLYIIADCLYHHSEMNVEK